MKKLIIVSGVLMVFLSLGSPLTGKGGAANAPVFAVNNLPKEALSQKEIEGLVVMREEEKLARDVYTALYKMYNLRIFNNISNSEQRHTSRIKDLLDKYQLEDPVANLKSGVFHNPEFQDLYNQLVAKGSKSLVEALKVGAMIEDLDIKDLDEWLKLTDNRDIRLVYENLKKGSRNHMRSFYKQLSRNGVKYTAQYIGQEELNAITGSSMERSGK